MAKTTGLFKKKIEERSVSARDADQSPRLSKDKTNDQSALGDAFEEMEAEEKGAGSQRRLFRESSRPEDELLQFLSIEPKKETEIAPPEVEKPVERPMRLTIRREAVRSDASQPPVRIEKSYMIPEIEPAPVASRPEAAMKAQPSQPPQQTPPMSSESGFPEDAIYEMIKAQDFSRAIPPPAHGPLKQVERPKPIVQRILRAPSPVHQTAERTIVMAPVEDMRVQVPIKAAPLASAERKIAAGAPILIEIRHDYLTLTLLMRWVEFLFERVTRDKLSLVLDYYVDVGWIADSVRSAVMTYARGEMQDITKYIANEDEISDESPDLKVSSVAVYKKVDDWRLSADDHLKSLLFITKMAGVEVDKDKLNSLEQSIKRFKENLEGYYGV